MTKGTIPSGAEFDQEQDEFFERSSVQAFRDMISAADWTSAAFIWIGLEKCHPATRRRILAQALRLCCERQQPPPAILVEQIENQLVASMVPRARAKDANLVTEVAHYLVRHPRASHRKIAAALGRHAQGTTIYRLFDRQEFWAALAEESARFDDMRAHDVLKSYVEKFGKTFEYATAEVHFAALSSLVPSMIDALEDGAPPLNNKAVREIATNQSKIRSEAALRRRLLPVAS